MACSMVKHAPAGLRHPIVSVMRIFSFLVIGAALCAQMPPPQQPADEIPTLKVDVSVVNVLASVRDKRGALVGNLEKKDFTVLEDGKPQEIKYFTRETDLPLTIGLLVDVSGSQRNLIDIERNAASQFFSRSEEHTSEL